jgi:DNA mismatch repair protein MutS
MSFHSILFADEREDGGAKREAWGGTHDFFVDLNLDQIVSAITAGREEYKLQPFFLIPLKNVDSIKYRHEVMRDIEDSSIRRAIDSFAEKMRTMRHHLDLVQKVSYKYNKEGWFLNAIEVYCEAVNSLKHDLAASGIRSRGLLAFAEYLNNYTERGAFAPLFAETTKMRAALSTVKYCLLVKDNQFTVIKDEEGADYSKNVEETFERFKQGAVRDYRIEFAYWPETNRIETKALEFVSRLYQDVFSNLDSYCAKHADYIDKTVAGFDREIQFYLAYLELVASLRDAGLHFCYPEVSDKSKEIRCNEGFDLALATKLVREKSPIVCNDFYLKGNERIFVVNGPNQGGKTTFARSFGQLHYLAILGCLVPGRDARVFLFDRLFTHFEREESLDNLRSKLEDDLVRIHSILAEATPNSIIVVNEEFSSSTVKDASFLGKKVLEQIIRLDAICVYVTFLDELSSLEKTVSVLSTVDPENPDIRTYKIERRPADGRAYAIAIARKHKLSYESIKERIRSS